MKLLHELSLIKVKNFFVHRLALRLIWFEFTKMEIAWLGVKLTIWLVLMHVVVQNERFL
jgi:hypothetical protein